MNVSKSTTGIYITLFPLVLLYSATTVAAETESKSTYVEVGAEYEHSNRVSEPSDTRTTDNAASADIEVGYQKSFAKTDISLTYNAKYTDPSEDDSYWVGNSALSQQLFTKNVLFNLQHTRQRYIIDQSQADDAEDNLNEKDLLKAGLQWFIPYSQRTTFIASADHGETWYSQASTNNYNTNEGKLTWKYALTEKSTLQASYSASETNYDDYDSAYNEHQLDAKLTRQYQFGTYSLNIGKTWINGLSSDYTGEQYGLDINAKIDRHLLTFSATKTLSSSSSEVATSTSTSANQNQLLWYTYLSLADQYTFVDGKLVGDLNLYFAHEDQVATLYATDTDIYTEDKYGAKGELTWILTEDFSSSFSVNYYQADLSSDDSKTFAETKVAGKYNLNKSVYIELSAAFEKLDYDQSSSGYKEQNYATRIAFRY